MPEFSHVYFYDDDQSNIYSVKKHLANKVTCTYFPNKTQEQLTHDIYQTNPGDYINGIPLTEIRRIGFDVPITYSLFAFDWDETISCVNGVSYPPLGPNESAISFDDARSLVFWPDGLEGYLVSIMGGPERISAIRDMFDRLINHKNTVVILTTNESASIYGMRGTRPLFIEMVNKLHPNITVLSSYTHYPKMELNEETGHFEYASIKGNVLLEYLHS